MGKYVERECVQLGLFTDASVGVGMCWGGRPWDAETTTSFRGCGAACIFAKAFLKKHKRIDLHFHGFW